MNTVTERLRNILLRKDVLICLLSGLMFHLFPQIDLWVSHAFYSGGEFYLGGYAIVQVTYKIFAKIHFVLLMLFIAGIVYFATRKDELSRKWRKKLRFLLLVLVVAPGLLVNVSLKDNSFGRPRPVHLSEFGGEATFAPAFKYSGECDRNCSFVSGHAAIGFFFIAFGWVFNCYRLFGAGVVLGLFVGLIRIVQGGHFLSDVVFSFWVVYFTALFSAYCYQTTFSQQRRLASQGG